MTHQRRTGVLGGTFDPIHLGHLDAADAVSRALALDTVLLVPSRVPPHRPTSPQVSELHRFAMVALAASASDHLIASDLELTSSDPSYTSVTLRRLAGTGAESSQLFFITGADAFAEIASWYDYPAVLNRSHFVAVSRPGCPAPALRARLPNLAPRMHLLAPGDNASVRTDTTAIWLVDAQTRETSSSEIRRRLNSGQSIEGLVPDAVAAYIARHELYSPSTAAHDLHERT